MYIYLELIDEKHHKFYELTVTNKTVIAIYGRIGYTGTIKTYSFTTSIESGIFFIKQANRKKKKGYIDAIKGQALQRPTGIHPRQLQLPFMLFLVK